MTAVEWLQNELNTKGKLTPVDFFQASKMFECQVKDAYIEGYSATENLGDSEQYYNETYKNGK